MERFALKEQSLKFVHLNTRTEGGDNKGAFDVKLVAHLPKELLDILSPGLAADTYKEDTIHDLAGGKNLVLKHSEAKYPLGFEYELIGAKVTIHHGVESVLVIEDARVNNFSINPLAGGTVETTLRVQVVGHNDVLVWLYDHQKSDITVTIEPPALAEMAEAA